MPAVSEHKNPWAALLEAQAQLDPHAEGPLVVRWARETPRPAGGTYLERFLNKVAFGLCDCWYWTASRTRLGYGTHGSMLGEVRAHRFAYRLFKGPIPSGMCVMHTCDVRYCVNPDHLVLGSHKENMRDMQRKGRGVLPNVSGERNPQARLTDESVKVIRELVAAGRTQISVARQFGVSPMAISRVVRKETWR